MPFPAIDSEIWVQVLAGGCVGVYAWERFSTPATSRSTTTRWQWNIALFGYVAAAVALWWVLKMVISTNPDAARFIMFGAGTSAEVDKIIGLSAPFAAALFLTALLPHLPVLRKLDAAFRDLFRELGAIPKRARQLSAMVRGATFAVPAHLAGQVERELGAQKLCARTLMAADPHSPAWKWVRIVTLKTRLCGELAESSLGEERDQDPTLEIRAPFVQHRLAEYRQIMASYRRLASLASIVLAEPGAPDRDSSLRERHDGLLSTFEEESAELLRGLSHFLSCYLLSTQFSMGAAVKKLEGWGLTPAVEAVRPILRWHDLVGLALMTMAYMYLWFQMLGGPSNQMALVISVMIGLSMAAAALVAGVPGMLSRRRGHVREDGLSFGFYVVAAALAALCWCGIFYLRLLVMEAASLPDFLAALETKFPFMLMPAGAAFTIALLIDLDLRARVGLEWLGRFAEGTCLAVAMGVTGYFAADLMATLGAEGRSPDPVRIMSVHAGLGLLLGSVVPSLYRRARLQADRRAEHDEAAALPGEVVHA